MALWGLGAHASDGNTVPPADDGATVRHPRRMLYCATIALNYSNHPTWLDLVHYDGGYRGLEKELTRRFNERRWILSAGNLHELPDLGRLRRETETLTKAHVLLDPHGAYRWKLDVMRSTTPEKDLKWEPSIVPDFPARTILINPILYEFDLSLDLIYAVNAAYALEQLQEAKHIEAFIEAFSRVLDIEAWFFQNWQGNPGLTLRNVVASLVAEIHGRAKMAQAYTVLVVNNHKIGHSELSTIAAAIHSQRPELYYAALTSQISCNEYSITVPQLIELIRIVLEPKHQIILDRS